MTTLRAATQALWQEARHACDDALARGFTFVLVLHAAEAFADDRLLTDEDRERSARFHQPSDRHNFVLGRTMVHQLVRARGASTPYALCRGPYGKPFLPDAPAFSLSHSDRWIACAVSVRDPIGMDIETFARLGDYRSLLGFVSHPAERRCIEEAMPHERLPLFKRCWTRKEAVLKAVGKGIADDLKGIDVCLNLDEPLLSHPAPLRVIDMRLQDDQVTAALAQTLYVAGTVVMVVRDGVHARKTVLQWR
jgi:4'-phosphopantetheinyl transferase